MPRFSIFNDVHVAIPKREKLTTALKTRPLIGKVLSSFPSNIPKKIYKQINKVISNEEFKSRSTFYDFGKS